MSSSSEKAPDFEPPQTSVGRIIKGILPSNVMVTKEARAAFTRAAGIFIFYLTHCANEFSREGKRTTISAQDIKNALRELDFEDFEVPLDEFLERKSMARVRICCFLFLLLLPPLHARRPHLPSAHLSPTSHLQSTDRRRRRPRPPRWQRYRLLQGPTQEGLQTCK